MEELRTGTYHVLIGVNLLREGLDLPEVALVAILDADKEGFLRDRRSMIQTAGRAARNINGRVIMYAKKITRSIQLTIDETQRRRAKQIAYNTEHNITPKQVKKATTTSQLTKLDRKNTETPPCPYSKTNNISTSNPLKTYQISEEQSLIVSEDNTTIQYNTHTLANQISPKDQLKRIEELRNSMQQAARELDFIRAAQLRDEILHLESLI